MRERVGETTGMHDGLQQRAGNSARLVAALPRQGGVFSGGQGDERNTRLQGKAVAGRYPRSHSLRESGGWSASVRAKDQGCTDGMLL